MSDSFHHTVGIVIRSIPFREHEHIFTLFSPTHGLIKLINKNRKLKNLCTPLNQVEVVFKEKKSEIFVCSDLSLIESYSFLRQEFIHLQTACELLDIVSRSFFAGTPSPDLYQLLKVFIHKIPVCVNLSVLTSAFKMKLMKCEGLWGDFLDPSLVVHFSKEDLSILHFLADCTSFNQLMKAELKTPLKMHIDQLFDQLMRH